MHIFRKRFLTPETIGIVPHGGYRKEEAQSIVAIKWLKWLSESESMDIQHARNGQEVRVLNYKVDGQLRSNPNQLFEFYGCIYHGCPECYKDPDTVLPRSSLKAGEALVSTIERQDKLEAAG